MKHTEKIAFAVFVVVCLILASFAGDVYASEGGYTAGFGRILPDALLLLAFAAAAVYYYIRGKALRERVSQLESALENHEEIKRERDRYENIINTAPLAYIMSKDGVVFESNEYARALLGAEHDVPMTDLYASPSQRDYLIKQVDAQGHIEGQIYKFNMKRGGHHRFVLNIRKVGNEGAAYYFWGIDVEQNELQKDNLEASQNKIMEVSERLTRIINSSPVYFLILVEGRIVEANEAVTGASESLRVGGRLDSFYESAEQRDGFAEELRTKGVIKNEVVRLKTSEGKIKRFLANAVTADYEGRDAVVVWAIDIEENESRAEQLESMQKGLQTMIDSLPITLVLIDIETGAVVDANEACLNMFEMTNREQVIGKHVSEFIPDETRSKYTREEFQAFIHRDTPFTIDSKYTTVTGRIFECRVTACVIEYMGRKTRLQIMQNFDDVKELERTQQSLQRLLDTMPLPVGIVDIETGRVVYGNRRFASMHEFDSPEDVKTKCVSDMFTDEFIENGGMDNLKRLEVEEYIKLEAQRVTQKGNIIDVRMYTSMITYKGRRSAVTVFVDLLREKEYKNAQEMLQMLLDLIPIPVRLMDLQTYMVIYANKACAELFGYPSPRDACVHASRNLPEYQTDGTLSRDRLDYFRSLQETFSFEMDYRHNNGGIIKVELTSIKIDYYGRRVSLGIIRDIGAEKEFQKMLVSAADKEKEANELKSRFLVNMSHEIRTPMNVIIGLTEIELHEQHPRHMREIFDKINTSAKNLLSIINDILDLSKIEADKIVLYNEEFELEEVLGSALLVAGPRLEGKYVEFMLNASLDLPKYLIGDRTRLWQILKNFLDNSAKFTEEGKVSLTVYEDKALSTDNEIYLTFIIEDTGVGMDEDEIQRVLQPYEQIRSEAQKRYTGTGLGMSISKQLCELMGGKLKIESRRKEGTIIHIGIPFKRSEKDITQLEALKKNGLEGLHVLAADDDAGTLAVIKGIIDNSGGSCDIVANGEQAVKKLLDKSGGGKGYDIVLLDYIMDGINGLDAAKEIQLGLSRAPKLLLVTAFQRRLLKNELDKNNIIDVIEKPFIPSRFIQRLRASVGLANDFKNNEIELACFKDVNVLVCEDYALNLEVAAGMLAQFGIVSTLAENGKIALELLETHKHFDLILMDLQMPVMDGYEAAREIRKKKEYDDIPIISLTADAFREVAEACISSGMDDHLAKPIDFESLNSILLKWLPESKLSDEAPVKAETGGLARFSGNVELYNRALLEFAGELPSKWPDFEGMVSNTAETRKYLHKIKGAAGNLSETGIYRFADSFGVSLRNGTPDRTAYEGLVRESGHFKERVSLKVKLAENGGKEGTQEEFKRNIEVLIKALDNYDLKKSTHAVEKLKAKTWPSAPQNKLNRLYELMNNYDYPSALDLAESFEMDLASWGASDSE